jgi:hypothetical protein
MVHQAGSHRQESITELKRQYRYIIICIYP